MSALDAMAAVPRSARASRVVTVLVPVSHPEIAPIHIDDKLFAIGRTEAPFDTYPPELAASLSRRHARIFCEHGALYFAELGSKNGSSINGVQVRAGVMQLHDGDLLGLGKTLTYRVQFDRAAGGPHPVQARLASLSLTPEDGAGGLQPIVVSEFPFLVSKADDSFARYKESELAQVNYLSRRHAHLFLKGGQPYIEDLGSTNGSFVNGTRLAEHAVALHEGDVLAFGGRYFVYRLAMQWEAAARDPTLTQVAAAAQAPDADRTTFVAAADSFLDIFCVDPAPGPDDGVNPVTAEGPPADEAPPQGKLAATLSGLHAALGGKGPLPTHRLRKRGLAATGVLAVLAALLYSIDRPARQVEGLLADGAYARAASLAAEALASDPDDRRLQALGLEALLKAQLPPWMAFMKTGQYGRAAQQVAAMRSQARDNPGLAPLLDELDWMVGLASFVADRGGAGAPVRDARDGARIARILEQWEEQEDAHQRAFETMSAHVPAFRDTYADTLSDLRRLALARTQP